MTNNQLAENSVIQLLNSVKLACDNAERADNRVDHSFYYALTIALEELQERRKAAMDSEPVAYRWNYGGTTTWRLQYTKPTPGSNRIWPRVIEPLYRHAQLAPEYPEVLPCSVLLEPGLRFGKGIKTSTMLAALARRAVHESDMAALSPEERAEFQAGIEDVKALIAQPAPVAQCPYPCGWDTLNKLAIQDAAFVSLALVAGEPATESIRQAAITNSDRLLKVISACRAAMLAAAAQPQNAQQNIPEIIPGWIPVSERVPNCWCRTCRPVVINDMRFVVCPECGNKRCPRANDHRNACTGSNEPGQEGSAYPADPQEVPDGK